VNRTLSAASAGFPVPFFHCHGGPDEDAKGMKSARSRLTTRLLFALLLVVLAPIPDALADCTDPPEPAGRAPRGVGASAALVPAKRGSARDTRGG